jgi:hypothetical protein
MERMMISKSKHLAMWLGAGMALIDFIVWLVIGLIGSGWGLFGRDPEWSWGVNVALASMWNWFHAPVNAVAVPYLVGHVPSHGGGVPAIASVSFYVVLCLLQAFFVGFLLGKLLERLGRPHSGA